MEETIDKLRDHVSAIARFESKVDGIRRKKVFGLLVEETKQLLQVLIEQQYGKQNPQDTTGDWKTGEDGN